MVGMQSGRFSYAEERELIAMAAKGATVSQIAAKFRTTAATIELKAKRLGVNVPKDKKAPPRQGAQPRRSRARWWVILSQGQLGGGRQLDASTRPPGFEPSAGRRDLRLGQCMPLDNAPWAHRRIAQHRRSRECTQFTSAGVS
jgi:hypothetical protein